MNTTEPVQLEPAVGLKIIRLPLGLLGFENIKEYVLISEPDQAPFQWLQVPHDSSLAFIVVSPFEVLLGYEPDIPKPDVDFLGLTSPADARLLNIVTLPGNGRATINLKGPIVLNCHTLIGKQVVLTNAARYALQHPLPVAES